MIDRQHEEHAAEVERLRARVQELEGLLRHSQEHVRLFVTYTPAAVAMFDREMRYLLASRQWFEDYRLGDPNILGRTHYEVFPEIPERWKEIHRRCLAGATEECEEDPFPRADGTVDWVRWKIFPWHTVDGEIGGIIMFTEVITRRKELEQQLLAQQVAIQRLSTPIIPIGHRVLVMPLIGALDAQRCQQAMEHLLEQIARRQARTAIIDVTGVPDVDTQAAGGLVLMARGARLLGAEVVLSGIRPEVAQALVSLDVELSGIVTCRDLQSGVAFASGSR